MSPNARDMGHPLRLRFPTLSHKTRKDGATRCRAIAQSEENEEREPESACEFGECGALVGGEQREAGKDGDAAGQRGGEIVERFKRQRASGPSGSRQDDKGERDRREMPGKNGSQRRAQHPRERRVEDEARLAGRVVWAGRPVRIRDAVAPGIQAVEPGDEVHVEVVAAGVAANELRDDGDECGEEDERRAGEAAPTRTDLGR